MSISTGMSKCTGKYFYDGYYAAENEETTDTYNISVTNTILSKRSKTKK